MDCRLGQLVLLTAGLKDLWNKSQTLCAHLVPEWSLLSSPIHSFTQVLISPEAIKCSKIKTGFRLRIWALASKPAFTNHMTLNKACHYSQPAK